MTVKCGSIGISVNDSRKSDRGKVHWVCNSDAEMHWIKKTSNSEQGGMVGVDYCAWNVASFNAFMSLEIKNVTEKEF